MTSLPLVACVLRQSVVVEFVEEGIVCVQAIQDQTFEPNQWRQYQVVMMLRYRRMIVDLLFDGMMM